MHSKRSNNGDENGTIASISKNNNSNGLEVRTSSRVRRPTARGSSLFYTLTPSYKRKKKVKTRTAAAHIAKMLKPGGRRPIRNSAKSISNVCLSPNFTPCFKIILVNFFVPVCFSLY